MVGRSIASIYDLGSIFTSGCIRISAIDLPAVLRIYQSMIYYLSHTLLYYIICQFSHHCTHIEVTLPCTVEYDFAETSDLTPDLGQFDFRIV